MGQICFGSCFLVGLDSHLLLCVVVDLCAKRSHDFQTLSRQPWLRTFWRLLFQEFVFCKRLIGCFLIHLACIFVTCWACLTDPLHVSRVSDIFDVFGLWCGQSAFNKSLNLAKGAAIWERGQILGEWDFQLLSIRACGTRISLSRYVSVCVCVCLRMSLPFLLQLTLFHLVSTQMNRCRTQCAFLLLPKDLCDLVIQVASA